MTMNMQITPSVLRGDVSLLVPGDKSISQRVALLAGLASGESVVTGFLRSEDCLNTLNAMKSLGATVIDHGNELRITGRANQFIPPTAPLNMGNSGTGMRLLTGLLAGLPLDVELTGDASLCSRPMRRIKDPLAAMGAQITLTGDKETAPIHLRGGGLKGITYTMPMASAQVKSCILLAGLFADGETVVYEPAPCRDHTERIFQTLGIPLSIQDNRIALQGFGATGPAIKGFTLQVPGDLSSAAFFLVLAACQPGLKLTVENLGLNPGRTAMLDVLKRMGCNMTIEPTEGAGREPMGRVTVEGGILHGIEIGGREIPSLIDELPILAVAAALAKGTTVIKDARELRFKESDRIAVMCANMQAMGVNVKEQPDGMIIDGGCKITGGVALESHGDHRITMSLAILSLWANESVQLNNVACVNTSYPDYWHDLRTMGATVHEC